MVPSPVRFLRVLVELQRRQKWAISQDPPGRQGLEANHLPPPAGE